MNLQYAGSKVIDALDDLGVPYMLVGSFSSMYYAFPRSTLDADFVIGAAELDALALAAKFGEPFRADPQLSFETVGGSVKSELVVDGTPFEEFLQNAESPPTIQSTPNAESESSRRFVFSALLARVCDVLSIGESSQFVARGRYPVGSAWRIASTLSRSRFNRVLD